MSRIINTLKDLVKYTTLKNVYVVSRKWNTVTLNNWETIKVKFDTLWKNIKN